MRSLAVFAALALAAPGLTPAQSLQTQTVVLEANLSGDNENPPVTTDAMADVTVRMEFSGRFEDDGVFENVGEAFADGFDAVVDFFTGDDDPDADPPEGIEDVEKVTVRMRADLSGLSGQTFTGGHIHRGKADENGPVVVDFQVSETTPGGSDATVNTTVMLTSEMDIEAAFDIVANPQNYYVNVHTTANSAGEIRGQLRKSSETETNEVSRELRRLRQDVNAIMMTVNDIRDSVDDLASQNRLDQFNRIDENVANIGRRVGLNTNSEQVVGSAR